MQEDVYEGDGLNLYAYCANNPVVYYDPSGYVCGETGEIAGDGGESGQTFNKNSKFTDIDLNQKPTANSNKLQNFINSLYKGQGNPNQIGNGTTMDSIRYEIKTGNPVEGKFHSQKGQEFMNGINKLINSGSLDEHDEAIANAIVRDIANALSGSR